MNSGRKRCHAKTLREKRNKHWERSLHNNYVRESRHWRFIYAGLSLVKASNISGSRFHRLLLSTRRWILGINFPVKCASYFKKLPHVGFGARSIATFPHSRSLFYGLVRFVVGTNLLNDLWCLKFITSGIFDLSCWRCEIGLNSMDFEGISLTSIRNYRHRHRQMHKQFDTENAVTFDRHNSLKVVRACV